MAIANINQYGITLGTSSNNTASNNSKLELNSNWVNAGIYPVGSIYFSVSSINPSNYFGGTWIRFSEGEVLLCVDADDTDTTINTPNKNGGAKTVTLTTNTIPSHRHNWSQQTNANASGTSTIIRMTNYGATNNEGNTSGESTGGGAAHNNLQPYITCYIWLRTE